MCYDRFIKEDLFLILCIKRYYIYVNWILFLEFIVNWFCFVIVDIDRVFLKFV